MLLETLLKLLEPINILMLNIGVAAGIIIGTLPGLNVVFAIAVLLPLTFGLDSVSGMLLLLGSYCGATFGGSITAILINTPGTAGNAATTIEGYPMAKKGKAGNAIKIALISSVIGGLISCVVLLLFAPQLAKIALHFGPPEFFALTIFGMCAVVGITGKKVLKGLIMTSVGLLISTVGIDAAEGVKRFTFGSSKLTSGIKPVILLLGIFAIAEVILQSEIINQDNIKNTQVKFEKATITVKEILCHWKTIIRSSIIGVIIGAIPGTGGGISSWFSYNEAKRVSKENDIVPFGEGNLDGLVAAETGNNATTGATLIPLLTLGIPGDPATAVLLGALTMQGIIPGSALFTDGSIWVYAIMIGLFFVNIFLLIQGLFFSKAFANITRVPKYVLFTCIVFLCIVGAFSIANSTFDVLILIVFGFIGYVLKKLDFPIPPLVIAVVLGELMEVNLRRALILSNGNPKIFLTNPISAIILLVSLLSLLYPFIRKNFKGNKKIKIHNSNL